ncbi:response regulator transcription factor [Robiginitalea sediminis]|uniref:response regulator transcription factor n=1 Tax=Robiginitalea sediminis TaxID=1982593 RepID=UPI000B4C0F56|nr:response regulator transcription factor [Robiginitalea sediminis]
MNDPRLLLAEDDEMLASLLRYRLEKEGYLVEWVSDGRAMKESLERTLPDIVVSDVLMPYFSGIEMVDYLRNEIKSSIPVILISTAGNETNVLNAFELGADDFIAKPVSPSELMVRIHKILKTRVA